ncbi:MAG: hypothetical protein JHC84_16445 [Solirubrobacteraceae bacterium]|nr:hypothetical protein [Solirubrobacteraceae bacterium]
MSSSRDRIAALAARGPRVTGHADAVEAAIAAVRDGARRHYEADPHDDLDLELLQGDASYAEGLSRLAQTGDLVAIAELAEVISLTAAAQAAGDEVLAEAAWEAGAAGIGWGPTPELVGARARARSGDPAAASALMAAARQITGDVASGR